MTLFLLNKKVSEALIAAHEGGFNFQHMTAYEVAEDLNRFVDELEEYQPKDLVFYVEDWFKHSMPYYQLQK